MLRIRSSFNKIYASRGVEFSFRFINIYMMSLLYGEYFVGAISIILSLAALAQTVGSLFDLTTVRFFRSMEIERKSTWIFGVAVFKFSTSFIILGLVFGLISSGLIYKEYLANADVTLIVVFIILFSSFFDTAFNFVNNLYISSENFESSFESTIIFFFFKFFLILFFIIFQAGNIQSLFSIYLIPFLGVLVHLVLKHGHNFKTIDSHVFSPKSTLQILNENFKEYTSFELLKLPVSYLKTNVLSMVSPALVGGDMVFVFVLFNKLYLGVTTLFSSTSMSFLGSGSRRSKDIFRDQRFVFFGSFLLLGALFVSASFILNTFYATDLRRELILFFFIRTMESVLVLYSIPYSVKVMSSSDIRPFMMFLLLPDLVTILVVFLGYSLISLSLLALVFFTRSVLGLIVFFLILKCKK